MVGITPEFAGRRRLVGGKVRRVRQVRLVGVADRARYGADVAGWNGRINKMEATIRV